MAVSDNRLRVVLPGDSPSRRRPRTRMRFVPALGNEYMPSENQLIYMSPEAFSLDLSLGDLHLIASAKITHGLMIYSLMNRSPLTCSLSER